MHAVIVRHNTTLTYEVLICKLMRIDGVCTWHVIDHKDIYISRELAVQAARQWCELYGYLYLGIKSGYANFQYDEAEFLAASVSTMPE